MQLAGGAPNLNFVSAHHKKALSSLAPTSKGKVVSFFLTKLRFSPTLFRFALFLSFANSSLFHSPPAEALTSRSYSLYGGRPHTFIQWPDPWNTVFSLKPSVQARIKRRLFICTLYSPLFASLSLSFHFQFIAPWVLQRSQGRNGFVESPAKERR